MTVNGFIKKLRDLGISEHLVCFNDSISDDVFFVNESYGKFTVGYRERGISFDTKSFDSLDEALDYLLNVLID